MFLRFIGKDKSMGLKYGHIYHVTVSTHANYIWVRWGWRTCPYCSPQTFAENWSKP